MSVIEQQAATISAGTWQSDPVHSSVGFEVKYLGTARFRGEVSDFTGQLRVDDGSAELVGSGRVASLKTKDENLDAHLQSPDFFDSERHPDITFRSTDVTFTGGTGVRVPGELTIKGVTRPATLTGTVAAPTVGLDGTEKLGLELSTTIDRTEFGVSWNAPLPGGELTLANDVALRANLLFAKETE
jgi:polyisoprenoid-binding protein YceI